MKRFVLLLALSFASFASASVTGNFYDLLSASEKSAAGIENLTPQQQAALNVLANRWVEQKAEPAINAARSKAVAEVREQVKAEEAKKIGFTETKNEEVIRSQIVGEFRGWGKGTVIRLENGQSWVVLDSDSRFFPKRARFEVEIRPSSFGTWKLTLLPEGLWVRVKRVQ